LGEADPRQAAFDVLRRVDQEGAWSSVLLQHLTLPQRDIALATELVYGVLRRQMRLDQVIERFASRPLDRIDPALKITLRLALYQILHLTRIPPHAAVNEAVEMARRVAGRYPEAAAGFVNGMLRAVLRDRPRAEASLEVCDTDDPAPALAVSESCPEWLVRRWLSSFGRAGAADLLAAMNRPASVALRVTTRGGSRDGVAGALESEEIPTRPSRYLPDFLVADGGAPQRTEAFRRGDFYIQDEASGLVARMAGAVTGDRILDACAAPGGKALSMAQSVGPTGLVIAADLHPSRLRLLRANAERLGLAHCVGLAADLSGQSAPLSPASSFDVVLVDAPCSGTGVIRRNPELRYRLSPGSLSQLAALQHRLLSRCAGLVRPGGALVYSVCSLEPEEGVRQAERFGHEQPGFLLADPRPLLDEAARALVADTAVGPCLVTLPHRDDLDGFFAARWRRQR